MMAGNDVELDTPEKRQQMAMLALKDEELLEHIVELLCGKSRLKRQKAASIVAIISNEDATVLLPYAEDICEALNHLEAQTRWEVLHTLDQMGKVGQRYDEDTLALAEDALYDENNGIVREAAFRFLSGYGSASPENSNEVWPRPSSASMATTSSATCSRTLSSLRRAISRWRRAVRSRCA